MGYGPHEEQDEGEDPEDYEAIHAEAVYDRWMDGF